MGARWMQSKIIKQRRERRAWAKPFSIKNNAGPNWHNGRIAREGSLDLSEEIRVRNEAATRKPRIPEIHEVRKEIPDALFCSTKCDTPHHRCRIYFDPRMTKYILQYVVWSTHTVKISITYPSFTVAWNRFMEDKVRWRKTMYF